jgi:hypothetical protein
LGIITDVKPETLKAEFPIVVTEFGIVMDVSRPQLPKAEFPIVVTELGMLMDVILHDIKAKFPILVTLSPNITVSMSAR